MAGNPGRPERMDAGLMQNRPPSPLVSVIIVNYNGKDLLPACLSSLSKQTFSDFEIIVVDNGSADGSDSLPEFPGLRVLKLKKNTGFAHACNRGAEAARGKWLAMLNTDAFPEPGWLASLLHAAKKYPEYDFFTSHQILRDHPDLLDGTGDMLAVNGRAWRPERLLPLAEGTNRDDEVFGACAAACLYRADSFGRAGGFDEDFFCYYEDVDLSLRLRLMGYRCMHVCSAIVYHISSATSGGEESDFFLYHVCRNLTLTYIKSMPGILIRKYILSHIRLHYDIALHLIQHRRRKLLVKIWAGIGKGLPRVLAKRKKVQRESTVCVAEPEHIMLSCKEQ